MSADAARVIPMRSPSTVVLADWAAFYCSLGLRVLPLEDRGKAPRTAHGVKDASAEPGQVARWWQRWPQANVGIACGDGLVVFDVDGRNGGHETWDRIMSEHSPPACPMVTTGDGLHLYMRDSSGRVRSKKLKGGIDVQAAGTLVVAPPSIHPSGKRYRWGKSADPVATRGLPAVPASLLDALDPPRSTRRPVVRGRNRPASGFSPYGRKALDNLLEEVRCAPQGQRHDTIYRSGARAGALALEGHLIAVAAFDELLDAGREAYGGEDRDEEIARTLADAFKRARHEGAAS